MPSYRRVATLENTNICNANCIFCGYQYQERARGVQSWDSFIALARLLREHAPALDIINFTPMVGDPLVDPKLLDKIVFCKQIGFRTILMTTNLIGLKSAAALLRSGVDVITISMPEPDAESYGRIYRNPRFALFLKNLDELTILNRQSAWPVRIALGLRGPKTRWELLRGSPLLRRIVGRLQFGLYDLSAATSFDNWGGRITAHDLLPGMTIRPNLPKSEPCYMLGFYGFTWDNRMMGCACRDLDVSSDLDFGPATAEAIESYHHPDAPLGRVKERWSKGQLPASCQDCRQYVPASSFFRAATR